MTDAHVSLLLRALLSSILLAAGAVKLLEPVRRRTDAVAAYDLLPPLGNSLVGFALPFAEIAVGLALVAGATARPAGAAAALLFFVFAGAMALTLVRGRDVGCGCFGASDETKVSWRHVTANLALTTAAVTVARVDAPTGAVSADEAPFVFLTGVTALLLAGCVAIALSLRDSWKRSRSRIALLDVAHGPQEEIPLGNPERR